MGVNRTDYIMLAIKLPFDGEFCEKLSELGYDDNGYSKAVKAVDGISLVADGMNGKYMMIGKIISKAIDFDGFDMTECVSNDPEIIDIGFKVSRLLLLKMCQYPKYYVFSHFH